MNLILITLMQLDHGPFESIKRPHRLLDLKSCSFLHFLGGLGVPGGNFELHLNYKKFVKKQRI